MKPQILTDIDDLKKIVDKTTLKIGNFTKLTTDASGAQSITGVGFKPSGVLFLAVVSASAGRMSVGFSNVTTNKGIHSVHNAVAGAFSASDTVINMRQGSGGTATYTGVLQSLDTDGFTINWTKGAGAVDGETITVQYLAIK